MFTLGKRAAQTNGERPLTHQPGVVNGTTMRFDLLPQKSLIKPEAAQQQSRGAFTAASAKGVCQPNGGVSPFVIQAST